MMTDITLIFPKSPLLLNQAAFPPLGIMSLSAYLKEHNFTVQCLDAGLSNGNEDAFIGQISSEIVGVSITTPQRWEAFRIASKLLKMGKVLIAGGPHATHKPEECLRAGFHYVVRGEGEIELCKILMDIIRGRQEDTCMPLSINMLPFPDRDALPIRKYKYTIDDEPATVLMSSRGCPFHCSFCAKVVKKCSIQHAFKTVREIISVHEQYGFKAFMFFDDVFTVSRKRLYDIFILLKMYDRPFKFRCFSRSTMITDEVCDLLKRMGVVEVGLGIESGSTEILKRNMKGTTREANTKAVKMLHQHGIRAKAFLIVGLPGESFDTIKETESWIKEAKPYDVDISVLQPYPGSSIFNDPKHYGINFNYEELSFYKGTPGKYIGSVSTEKLTSEEILYLREDLENKYKRKELLR